MSSTLQTRSTAAVGFLCALVVLTSGCVSNKAIQSALAKPAQLPVPVAPIRSTDAILVEFGAMLGPYVTAATGERPIPIEIDFIGNESGIDKELPTDLSQYARNVIEKIGGPFETYRTWPAIVASPRPAGSTALHFPNDRPKPPEPAYRVVGSLLRASERAVVGRDNRGDGMFGGGHTQTDLQLSGDQRRTITSLTLALTLEGPSGVAVRGASAEYRIEVEKNELNRSISIYVGGSGIGGGKKLTVTQDTGDALYNATAVAVMHLLGNALMVPYYRCGSLFPVDDALDNRVMNSLNRLTQSELERNVKRYLFADGYTMDMRGPDLTEEDRAVAVLEMRRRSLEFSDRGALVEFTMQLWKNLDYTNAAKRVADRISLSAQQQRERIEQAAREQAALVVSPAEFGWPVSVRLVVVDLSRVKEGGAQDKIIAAVRTCAGCDEIRAHPTKMLLGIRLSSSPMEIQHALRASGLPLVYVWNNNATPRLILAPAKVTGAIAAAATLQH